jgi:drug/metabolite transporter (DMT)-like permease
MAVATGQTMTAALLMIPIVLVIDQPWTMAMPRLDATLAGLALALLSTALAYALYFRLIDRAGASNAQLVAFLMPILAVILGFAFLGESLNRGQVVGAVLIAIGLAIIDGRLLARFRNVP